MHAGGTENPDRNSWRLGIAGLALTAVAEAAFLFVLWHAFVDVRGNGRTWFVHHTGVASVHDSSRLHRYTRQA